LKTNSGHIQLKIEIRTFAVFSVFKDSPSLEISQAGLGKAKEGWSGEFFRLQ
jgi:hypothetical protein